MSLKGADSSEKTGSYQAVISSEGGSLQVMRSRRLARKQANPALSIGSSEEAQKAFGIEAAQDPDSDVPPLDAISTTDSLPSSFQNSSQLDSEQEQITFSSEPEDFIPLVPRDASSSDSEEFSSEFNESEAEEQDEQSEIFSDFENTDEGEFDGIEEYATPSVFRAVFNPELDSEAQTDAALESALPELTNAQPDLIAPPEEESESHTKEELASDNKLARFQSTIKLNNYILELAARLHYSSGKYIGSLILITVASYFLGLGPLATLGLCLATVGFHFARGKYADHALARAKEAGYVNDKNKLNMETLQNARAILAMLRKGQQAEANWKSYVDDAFSEPNTFFPSENTTWYQAGRMLAQNTSIEKEAAQMASESLPRVLEITRQSAPSSESVTDKTPSCCKK